MNLYKYIMITCLFSFVLVSPITIIQGQENKNFTEHFMKWQNSNCGINNDPSLISVLRQNPKVYEKLFIKAFREGPTNDYISDRLQSELERLRSNQAVLKEGNIDTGLSKENLDIALKFNIDESREVIKQDIIFGWKSRALTGLSYLKTRNANSILKNISANKKSDHQSLANYLIKSRE